MPPSCLPEQEEIENEENQEMEQIQGRVTPEDSTFTLSSDGMSEAEWERPVMNFAEDETRLVLSEIGNGNFCGNPRSEESLINGGIAPDYASGDFFFNGLPRSTPV
ncbi:unnamed protein product [Allacma fusca]|uniref:Uncharacterized protein n=1 Tax=Allacma fusca TaxID=39272 RepID=A0A8J2L3M7_9HEXA|nr:unnamed protein product [Allacma fusca]